MVTAVLILSLIVILLRTPVPSASAASGDAGAD
jgi:hypothetical protein